MWDTLEARQGKGKWAALLCLSFVLSSCAVWEQPGKGEEDAARDEFACEKQAWEKYPVSDQWVMVTPPHWVFPPPVPGKPCCPPARFVGPRYDLMDVNREIRFAEERRCMQEKGWTTRYVMPWSR